MKNFAKIKSLAPRFLVADVLASVDYYREQLGFELVDTFQDPPTYATVSRDGGEVHLARRSAGMAPGGIRSSCYAYTDDVDALYEEMGSREARIVEGPTTRVYGMREFVVEDPDGNRLVFAGSIG